MDAGSIGWVVAAGTAAGAFGLLHAAGKRAERERMQAQAELAALRERAQQLAPEAGRASELSGRVGQLEVQGERLQVQLREAEGRVARAEAELQAARDAHEQTRAFLTEAQGKLSAAFHEVASKLFDEKSMALDQRIKESGEASRLGIDATLRPFAKQLNQFRTRIEDFTSKQGEDHARFIGAFGELRTLNQNMADAAGGLTRALKGNAKARGDWGEMILETVLKASGLVEGVNYQRQGGTRDEEGRLFRPDAVILLPDGRRVVVDSKVNLVD